MADWRDREGQSADGSTAKLEIASGPLEGTYIHLEVASALILGRAEPPPANLGGDGTVSARHAQVIVADNGSASVEDLGSTNGTWVNGRRIDVRAPLRDGDLLQVGATHLRVRDDHSRAPSASVFAASTTAEHSAVVVPNSSHPPRVRDRRWSNSLIGVARGLNERSELRMRASSYGTARASSVTTVRFRLEPLEGGPPVVVKVKGRRIDGGIEEGEVVEARGSFRRGEYYAQEVFGHETGDTLRVKFPVVETVVTIIGILAVTAAILAIFVFNVFDRDGGGGIPDAPTPAESRQASINACLSAGFSLEECEQQVPG
jgi:hypothetical protein